MCFLDSKERELGYPPHLAVLSMELHGNVSEFKRVNRRRVEEEGTKVVLAIQKLRAPLLDVWFQAWSFCAEEE